MIVLNSDTVAKVKRLRKDMVKVSADYVPVDMILGLVSLYKTYDVVTKEMNHVKDLRYWEFLHAIIEYIGNENILSSPAYMAEHYVMIKTKNSVVLTPVQILAEKEKYLAHRKEVFTKLGLSYKPQFDRELLVLWLRRKKGFTDMLDIAEGLVNVYTFYN